MISLASMRKAMESKRRIFFTYREGSECRFAECSTNAHFWTAIFPQSLCDQVNISYQTNPSVLSSIFGRYCDKGKHGSDSKRERAKTYICKNGLRGISCQINRMIDLSAIAEERDQDPSNGEEPALIMNLDQCRERYFVKALYRARDIALDYCDALEQGGLLDELRDCGFAVPCQTEVVRSWSSSSISWIIALSAAVAIDLAQSEEGYIENLRDQWSHFVAKINRSAEAGGLESQKFESPLKDLSDIANELLDSIVRSKSFLGVYSADEEKQNATTCEGLYALLLSGRSEFEEDAKQALAYLESQITDKGIPSKSLGHETVVPTSYYLRCLPLIKAYGFKTSVPSEVIFESLFESRSPNGWGVYVEHDRAAAVLPGPTFWALYSMISYGYRLEDCYHITKSLLEKSSKGLYGDQISESCRMKATSLCVTSMMFILYPMLPDKSSVSRLYDAENAFRYIYQKTLEGGECLEREYIDVSSSFPRTRISSFVWQNVSIRFALEAIAYGMRFGMFVDSADSIFAEVLSKINAHTVDLWGHLYWNAAGMELFKPERGIALFPSTQLAIGILTMIRVWESRMT